MASKIKVDTIENVAGSGNVSLGSGHNLVVPGNITGQGTTTLTGNLTVDTNTLHVNASNNRVGIGTSSPDVPLEISVAGSSITNVLKLTTTGSGTVPALQFEGDSGGTQHIVGRIRGQQDDANDGGLVFETENSGTVAERMRINNNGQITITGQPSFSVSATPTNSGGRLHSFGTTQHNQGSHYNNSDGKFTAPVAGKYFFAANIWPSSGLDASNTYLVFFKNSTEQTGAHATTNKQGIQITAVYSLAANDTVHVQVVGGWSVQGSSPRNNFHGYMLG